MGKLATLFVLLSSLSGAAAFGVQRPHRHPQVGARRAAQRDRVAMDVESGTGAAGKARIKSLVEANDVVLFMKGNKMFPQCGFSNTAVQILGALSAEYESVDVLGDEEVRQAVKEYSEWPTIPQLYIKGEFQGGCDIMIELYQSGELQTLLGKEA